VLTKNKQKKRKKIYIFSFSTQTPIKMEPNVLLDLEIIYDWIFTKFRGNFSFDVQHQRLSQKLIFNFVAKPSFDSVH
jgi:hypothetical protein